MHTRPMILALFLVLPPVTSLAAGEGHHHDQHDMEQMHGGVGTTLGQPGNAHEITRTVTITVDDSLRYSPDSITVKPGASEIIAFKYIRIVGESSTIRTLTFSFKRCSSVFGS